MLRSNKAVNFDRTNALKLEYDNFNAGQKHDFVSNGVSYVCWANTSNGLDTNGRYLFRISDGGTFGGGLGQPDTNLPTRLYVRLRYNGSSYNNSYWDITNINSSPFGDAIHLAGVQEPGSGSTAPKLYVNGVDQGAGANASPGLAGGTAIDQIQLGCLRANDTYDHDGPMWNASIWEGQLTADQVFALYMGVHPMDIGRYGDNTARVRLAEWWPLRPEGLNGKHRFQGQVTGIMPTNASSSWPTSITTHGGVNSNDGGGKAAAVITFPKPFPRRIYKAPAAVTAWPRNPLGHPLAGPLAGPIQ